jgi:flavin reductase ActVB
MTAHVDSQTFRDAMAELAAPVTVVTTVDADGRRRGLTVSAVISVSLEPPLLVVSVSRTASCHPALASAKEFVVNVLGARHRELARRFATSGIDRFAGGEFATWPGHDLPCLPDARVLIRCASFDVITAGDHDLVVGAVEEVRVAGDTSGDGLVWYRRDFHSTAHCEV